MELLRHAACAALALAIATSAWAQEHIVFSPGWIAQSEFSGYYVAKEKGFYKELGLDVDIVHPTLAQPVMSRVKKGESHVATLELCQALEIIDGGTPLVNILQTSMNDGTMVISANGKDPRTQKGARIGIASLGFGHIAMCANKEEGLGFEWVPASRIVNLFLAGALDGILGMSFNQYYQLLQSGIELTEKNLYRFADHGYNIPGEGVYVTYDYYKKHRQAARNFAKASRKGWEWVAAHPEEALEIVGRYLKNNRIATNMEIQRLMLKEVLRLQIDRQSKKREFLLKPEMVKQASRLLKEYDFLKREIDYSELVERE